MYKLRGQGRIFELIKESTGEVVKKGTFTECYQAFEDNICKLQKKVNKNN